MIPLQLQLKNFLSYGDDLQTIDFSPYHMIYLSGKNGHGKSALLDAITWAIWGQARKVTTAVKADLGLLRLGQTNMMVILDFQLNGQHFRVRRELNVHYGKPTAYLEFGIINELTGEFISLTDKTIKATQHKIEQTIHLDYESFVNSAFLRQGHANEFCRKSPKDRKDILAAILGLQKFDLIKRRALEKAKQAATQQQTLRSFNEKFAQELIQKEALSAQLIELTNHLAKLATYESTLLTEKESLEISKNKIIEDHKQHDLLCMKQEQIATRIAECKTIVTTELHRWRSIHRTILSLDGQKLEQEKQIYTQQVTQWQKTFQESLQTKESILKIKEELYKKKSEFEFKTKQEEQALLTTLEQKKFAIASQEKEYQTQLITQQSLSTKLIKYPIAQEVDTLLERHERQFEKRRNMYQQFIAKGNWIKAELENTQRKKELIHDDDPSCPLCDQNLSIARRKFLSNTFGNQTTLLEHQLKRMGTVITRLKTLLIDQHKEIETLKNIKTTHQELHKINAQLIIHEAQQKLLTTEYAQLQTTYIKLKESHLQALTTDSTYNALQLQLATEEKKSTTIIYDALKHKTAQDALTLLEKKYAEFLQLSQEKQAQIQRQERITQTITSIRALQKEYAQLELLLKPFVTLAITTQAAIAQEKQYQEKYQLFIKEKETALQQQARLQTQLQYLDKMAQEQKKQTDMIAHLNTIIQEYQLIAQATGKDGIQALLIEEAIPEIENEANDILSRLTNNQSQVFIESLRDLKSGGSKETLDIKISDATGIRPYELFSGGEAFRIDFALRIAISKLLARRAGTALQTLIIDEGFGSQDEEGLTLIMDALYKIQDDFEKVIIVSHLPSMREQFPVHFMVSKQPNGSHVQVVEQD